jgi:hypothetical protein
VTALACACGCGASLDGLRADAVYASEACSKRARRADSPDKARTGVGSRGGNVRSVEEARSLHAEHKAEWTEKVSRHIAGTLLATSRFHADDLAPLEIPEVHSAIAGSQTSRFVGKGWMMEVGRRKCQHKAANGRKAGIYEITDLGRRELPKLARRGGPKSPPSAQDAEPGVQPVGTAASSEPEPLSLLPDGAGRAQAQSAFTTPEAA